jgi:FkbM family methyltransferase
MDTKTDADADIALISLADMYLYVFRQDHSFQHILSDPRAKEIKESEIADRWQPHSVKSDDAWALKGVGPMALASIHYWRHDIDFCYLDVGAHIGMTTIGRAIFYKRCGRNNCIFAFEPGNTFRLLLAAVELNRVGDLVMCVQAAVSDTSGSAQFYLTCGQSPASSLLADAVQRPEVTQSTPIMVNTVTIDKFLTGSERTSGIVAKIDTEGSDFNVLDGMKKTISDRLCTLQIEFFPRLLDPYVDPLARLLELGRDFYLVDLGSSPHIQIAPENRAIDEFVTRVRTFRPPVTDIFLIPKALPGAEVLLARILRE